MLKTIILLLVTLSNILADTYTTTASAGVWDLGGFPGPLDDITVNHNWSNYNDAVIENYKGTLTITNWGYYKINGSLTSWDNASILVQNTGNLIVSDATVLRENLSITINGHFEFSSSLINNANWNGDGTYYIAGADAGTGSKGSVTQGTLPIELISFTAKNVKKSTILKWTTASEINNSHFEIEKYFDGLTFEKIGFVLGNGNSSKVINYSFTDSENIKITNANNISYYRLKQIDHNENYEYSKTILIIQIENDLEIIQIGTSNKFRFDNITDNVFTISLYKVNGKLISIKRIKGNMNSSLNFKFNFVGSYILTLSSNSTFSSKRGVILN